MSTIAVFTPTEPTSIHRRTVSALGATERLRVVPWLDPVADPHGLHPCSRYVELYWLGVIGPPMFLLRPVVKKRGGYDDPEGDHESRHLLTHQS
jgi:hypothetical protein